MAFHVGQKVVCIKPSLADSAIRRLKLNDARVGNTYTVRRIDEHLGEVGLWVEEIVNPISQIWNDEYGFYAERFRPIVERKTDISFAHEILRKVTRNNRRPAHA